MDFLWSQFLDSRLDEVLQDLREHEGEFAVAHEKARTLIETIDPIIMNKEESLVISQTDCLNIRDMMDVQLEEAAIFQRKLYLQGYLDCVALLKKLGVLA